MAGSYPRLCPTPFFLLPLPSLPSTPPHTPSHTPALLLEEHILFLEMAMRSQPHKGQLSQLWPRSLGWLLCAQESSLAHLCPLLPASLLLAWPCPSGLWVENFPSFRALPPGSLPEPPSSCGATKSPWAPGSWIVKQPDLGSGQVSQISVFPSVKWGKNRGSLLQVMRIPGFRLSPEYRPPTRVSHDEVILHLHPSMCRFFWFLVDVCINPGDNGALAPLAGCVWWQRVLCEGRHS